MDAIPEEAVDELDKPAPVRGRGRLVTVGSHESTEPVKGLDLSFIKRGATRYVGRDVADENRRRHEKSLVVLGLTPEQITELIGLKGIQRENRLASMLWAIEKRRPRAI